MARSRPVLLAAAGALALLLTLALVLIPRGGQVGDDRARLDATALATAETAGLGALTPAMRTEIQRVVAADSTKALPRVAPDGDVPDSVVDDLVRCASFDGQRYCLGVGWTDRSQAQVRRSVSASLVSAGRVATSTGTGDLSPVARLARLAAMSAQQRAKQETAELTMAARSVAKVWLLRHEIQGVPLPADFLEEHPEAVATGASTGGAATLTARTRTGLRYPRHFKILKPRRTAEQTRTYWCGPTATQMIVWGWTHKKRSQGHWAKRLHTTTSGTSIWDVVRVVNNNTGWDDKSHAGPYIVLDISDWSFRQWYQLIAKHVSRYKAPVVLHPILLKKFYPYVDDDASGHFQVGRGYRHGKNIPDQIGYFEPWNQQRFDPSEPFIARVQWRSALKSYKANEAHFQHNIGV